MEEALISYLLADSGVQALARTAPAAARLYWSHAPQSVSKPYATLLKIDGLRDTPMDGPSGLQQSRIQIDCYGLTFASAKGLARAIEAALSGLSVTTSGIVFQGCFLDTERDGYERDATPDSLFRTSLDFNIFHKGV
jgi:Protein of unknown function (DUF3168)